MSYQERKHAFQVVALADEMANGDKIEAALASGDVTVLHETDKIHSLVADALAALAAHENAKAVKMATEAMTLALAFNAAH